MKPLTPDEYAGALARIGISNERFCRVVGVNPDTGRKWRSGKTPISPTVSALLRIVLALNMDAARLMELLPEATQTGGQTMTDERQVPTKIEGIKVSVNKNRIVVTARMETPAQVDELMRMLEYAKTQLIEQQGD